MPLTTRANNGAGRRLLPLLGMTCWLLFPAEAQSALAPPEAGTTSTEPMAAVFPGRDLPGSPAETSQSVRVLAAPRGVRVERLSTGGVAGLSSETGNPLLLRVSPAGSLPAVDGPTTLSSTLPEKWGPGTHLSGTISGGTALPGCLEPGSVRVTLTDGTPLQEGKDYRLNTRWAAVARTENGRISTDTQVLISYRVGMMRLDTVAAMPDGSIALIEGEPLKDTPAPPTLPPGATEVARVFRPYHAEGVEEWQIFHVASPFPEPGIEEMERRAQLLPRVMEKLRRGEPLTYVAWGDSVTVGADASRPEKGYAALFARRLQERFPASDIRYINAGIGGTNTDHRLPHLDEQVLSHRPDLVTIEFVNDMPFEEEHFRRNWNEALTRIRSTGAEVIVITPHFTMPEMMGHPHPRGSETRKAVNWLREIAGAHGVALADGSRRWDHLEKEGYPYLVFLKNGINHPDDRGHELFVRELLSFFPGETKAAETEDGLRKQGSPRGDRAAAESGRLSLSKAAISAVGIPAIRVGR